MRSLFSDDCYLRSLINKLKALTPEKAASLLEDEDVSRALSFLVLNFRKFIRLMEIILIRNNSYTSIGNSIKGDSIKLGIDEHHFFSHRFNFLKIAS